MSMPLKTLKPDRIVPLLALLAIALFTLIAGYYWALAILHYPLNDDAGYYLTAGRYIVEGLVPMRDFASHYSPGAYYLFAMLESINWGHGEAHRAFIYSLHYVNAALLYLLLIRVAQNKSVAAFYSLFFLVLVFSLDGQAIVLEPVQNFFIISALLSATGQGRQNGALLAGLLFGMALMAKQSSMFCFPALSYLVWANPGGREHCANSSGIRLVRAKMQMLLAVGASVPFLVFVAANQLAFFHTFRELATFSGGAVGYVQAKYDVYDLINTLFVQAKGERLIVPFAVVGALLLIIQRDWRAIAVVLGLTLNLLPILMVRGYGHYVQLLALWGSVSMALLHTRVSSMSRHAVGGFMMVFCLLFLFPAFVVTVVELRVIYASGEREGQVEAARLVTAEVDNVKDIMIVNAPWLYYLTPIVPPRRNLVFYNQPETIRQGFALSQGVLVYDKDLALLLGSIGEAGQGEMSQWSNYPSAMGNVYYLRRQGDGD